MGSSEHLPESEEAAGKLEKNSVRNCRDRARSDGHKLKKGKFRLDRQKFFTVRVVPWHRLFREVVDAPGMDQQGWVRPGAAWDSGRCPWPWQERLG